MTAVLKQFQSDGKGEKCPEQEGIKETHGRPHHPQANGAVERVIQTLMRSLQHYLDVGKGFEWKQDCLERVFQLSLHCYNNSSMCFQHKL
jgi:hypothetical protein